MLLALLLAAAPFGTGSSAARAAAKQDPPPAEGVVGGAPDGYVPPPDVPDFTSPLFGPPAGGEGNFLSAKGFLSFTQTVDREATTGLILNIHIYFTMQTELTVTQRALDAANEKLEQARLDLAMGLTTALEVERLALEAEIAAAEHEKAELELLKLVMAIKADTGQDVRKLECGAEEIFLILKPEDITLAEMVEWARAQEDKALSLKLQQGLLDIRIAYIGITIGASELAAVTRAKEDISMGVIMGRNTGEELKAASEALRTARTSLMSAISGYSMLLYSLNVLCNGELAEKAGVMTLFVGRDRPSALEVAQAEAARAAALQQKEADKNGKNTQAAEGPATGAIP